MCGWIPRDDVELSVMVVLTVLIAAMSTARPPRRCYAAAQHVREIAELLKKRGVRCLLHCTGPCRTTPTWSLLRRLITFGPNHQDDQNRTNNSKANWHEDRRPAPINFGDVLVVCHGNNQTGPWRTGSRQITKAPTTHPQSRSGSLRSSARPPRCSPSPFSMAM
jgi:hypothetical protein